MNTYRDLMPYERIAIQAFADSHGRRWKSELSDVYWYNARLWRGTFDDDDEIGTALHRIRNDFGPSWLFYHCKIKCRY